MIKYTPREQDLELGPARRDLDWQKMYSLALNPELAREVRASRMPEDKEACTMCGSYCALKIVRETFNF